MKWFRRHRFLLLLCKYQHRGREQRQCKREVTVQCRDWTLWTSWEGTRGRMAAESQSMQECREQG